MSRFIIKSIPFKTRISYDDERPVLACDQTRASKILAGIQPHGPGTFHSKNKDERNKVSDVTIEGFDVTDSAVLYSVPVGLGQPPTAYSLLIDISSANTWIGVGKTYSSTSTSSTKNTPYEIYYANGAVAGTEHFDQITLGGNLVAKKQSLGVASSAIGAIGFSDVDGVLGLGPLDLASVPEIISPVTENLYNAGVIPTISLGMSYLPNAGTLANGDITLGATDTAKLIGSINYVPITVVEPSNKYWGIDADVTYGEDPDLPLLRLSAGVVDVSTTLILIASDAFRVYQRATGAEEDPITGLLTVTPEQFAQMENLFVTIGSETYELTPNAQIWPRTLNEIIGGEKDKIYLVVADMGSPSGEGLDFILGFAFLQRFYSVFDTTNRRFGIAKTKYTTMEIN